MKTQKKNYKFVSCFFMHYCQWDGLFCSLRLALFQYSQKLKCDQFGKTTIIHMYFCRMEEYRRRRKEYKRKWMAAKRANDRKRKMEEAGNSSTDDSSYDEEAPVPENNESPEPPVDAQVMYDSHNSAHGDSDDHEDLEVCYDQKVEHADEECEWTWDMIDMHMVLSSDSEDELDAAAGSSLRGNLAEWVTEFGIRHNAVDKLLKILKSSGCTSGCTSNLPVTARALLNTAREIETDTKSGMEYVYLGLQSELKKALGAFDQTQVNNLEELKLAFNIDGVPIFKSTKKSMWPILCTVKDLEPLSVFPVTLTYGSSKPKDLEFLEDMVRDLNNLMENGLQYEEKLYPVSVSCVVCDAPAKAMVKSIKLYSGYYGCDKCAQEGVYLGRITYQETHDLELRTDATFRNQTNQQHHHNISPLTRVPIDMVKDFPVDYMHQVCLGVQKRFLLAWIRGKKEVRISSTQAQEISQRLLSLKHCIPNIFARKPRGLEEVDWWKATEYRQFLLYTGKIVLKGILSEDM